MAGEDEQGTNDGGGATGFPRKKSKSTKQKDNILVTVFVESYIYTLTYVCLYQLLLFFSYFTRNK